MGTDLGTKYPLTSPRTTNQAFALASAVVKSSIRSCRLISGLVMITSGACSIPLAVGSVPDGRRIENTGFEGSNPSSFNLCIQPPSCLPATETNISPSARASDLGNTYLLDARTEAFRLQFDRCEHETTFTTKCLTKSPSMRIRTHQLFIIPVAFQYMSRG